MRLAPQYCRLALLFVNNYELLTFTFLVVVKTQIASSAKLQGTAMVNKKVPKPSMHLHGANRFFFSYNVDNSYLCMYEAFDVLHYRY